MIKHEGFVDVGNKSTDQPINFPNAYFCPADEEMEKFCEEADELGVVALCFGVCAAWAFVALVCGKGKGFLVVYAGQSNADICGF